MRPTRRRGVRLATLVATVFLQVPGGGLTGASPYPATTLDVTGDFEGTVLTPSGWDVTAPAPNLAVTSSSRAVTGVRSLLVRDTSTRDGSAAASRPVAVTPGRGYVAQAWSYTTDGEQSFSLDFLDATGARLSGTSTTTSAARLVWSRSALPVVAPARAVSAVLRIASSAAGTSQGWWDAVRLVETDLPNGSFEAAPTQGWPVPAWTVRAGTGTSAVRAAGVSHAGVASLLLTDSTASDHVVARSALVPVFGGVGYTVGAWVRPSSGTLALRVVWTDSAGTTLSTGPVVPLTGSAGVWTPVSRALVAPPGARRAAVEVSTSTAAVQRGWVDAVTLAPSAPLPVTGWVTRSLGEPLRTRNTTTVEATTVDGRVKLYTVVSGYPALFEVADLDTGRVEVSIPFPDATISAVSAMTTGRDGRVYLGTSGGLLWRWTPGAASLEALGRVTPAATAVWDLETGRDGRVWGGTYPDGMLFAYDPLAGRVTSAVRVSSTHQYVRSVAVDDRYVWAGVASELPTVYRLDVADLGHKVEVPPPVRLRSGLVAELDVHGRYLSMSLPAGTTTSGATVAAGRYLYDTEAGTYAVAANVPGQQPSTDDDAAGGFYYVSYKSLVRVDGRTGERTVVQPTTMSAGRDRRVVTGLLAGRTSEWFLAYDVDLGVAAIDLATGERIDRPVTWTPGASRMKSLATGPDGRAWAGGFGGPSLAATDLADGPVAIYPPSTATTRLGEVEGLAAAGGYLYLGSYTGAKIFRFDPAAPWVEGTNPALLADLSGHGQDRPQAWAVTGSRVVFGTVPAYGRVGGELGVIDDPSGPVSTVPSPVPGQSVVALAASGTVVYGGTSRWGGLGSTPSAGPARLFAYDTATRRTLWSVAPAEGVQSYGAVHLMPDGSLWAAAGPVVRQVDPATGAVLRTVVLSTVPQPVETTWRNVDLADVDGLLLVAAGPTLWTLDPSSLRVDTPAATQLTHRVIAVSGRTVLYADGTRLMAVTARQAP